MLDLIEISFHLLGHQNLSVVCFLPSHMRKEKYKSKRKKYNTQVKYLSKLKEGINKNNSRFFSD